MTSQLLPAGRLCSEVGSLGGIFFSLVVIAATLSFLLEQEGSKAMGVEKVNLCEGEWEKVLAWKAGVQRLCLGRGSIAAGCGSLVNTLSVAHGDFYQE